MKIVKYLLTMVELVNVLKYYHGQIVHDDMSRYNSVIFFLTLMLYNINLYGMEWKYL